MIENQRQIDLLRYCRSQLHDTGLISDEEYSWLLAEQPGAVNRLETYDRIRARISELESKLAEFDFNAGGMIAQVEQRDRRIAELEAEMVALAGQSLELRGALEAGPSALHWHSMAFALTGGYVDENREQHIKAYGEKRDAALALPLPAAAANVAEWREKAELLDLLETKGWSLVHGIGVWNVMSRTGHSTVPVASGVTAIAALRAARGGR